MVLIDFHYEISRKICLITKRSQSNCFDVLLEVDFDFVLDLIVDFDVDLDIVLDIDNDVELDFDLDVDFDADRALLANAVCINAGS